MTKIFPEASCCVFFASTFSFSTFCAINIPGCLLCNKHIRDKMIRQKMLLLATMIREEGVIGWNDVRIESI